MMPVSFDLPKLSRIDLYLIFAPLFPGIILLGTITETNRSLSAEFIQTASIGYYSKVVCLFAVAYFLGLMTISLAGLFSETISHALGLHVPVPSYVNQPWNQAEWRKLAREFIGHDFVPSELAPLSPLEYATTVATAPLLDPDPEKRQEKLASLNVRRATDEEWSRWYFVLRNYVVSESKLERSEFEWRLFYLLHPCGIAGTVALILVPAARNWFLWVLFLFFLVTGFVFPFLVRYSAAVSLPVRDDIMCAQMLKILRQERRAKQEDVAAERGG
ncbi:MAG: hypothetical protein DMG25_04910 [Acidobacteria bacterium]|nr:MAG: hypothetical protein DMG25_04910 [Acidobacteriota bacterium]